MISIKGSQQSLEKVIISSSPMFNTFSWLLVFFLYIFKASSLKYIIFFPNYDLHKEARAAEAEACPRSGPPPPRSNDHCIYAVVLVIMAMIMHWCTTYATFSANRAFRPQTCANLSSSNYFPPFHSPKKYFPYPTIFLLFLLLRKNTFLLLKFSSFSFFVFFLLRKQIFFFSKYLPTFPSGLFFSPAKKVFSFFSQE